MDLALAHTGRGDALHQLQQLTADRISSAPNYAFDEYFLGVTGESLGTSHMACSATGIVFLDHAERPETRALFST